MSSRAGSPLPRPSKSPKSPSPRPTPVCSPTPTPNQPTHSDHGSGSIPICISICISICIAFCICQFLDTRTRSHSSSTRAARNRERAFPVRSQSRACTSISTHTPPLQFPSLSSHHPSSPSSSSPTRRRPLNNKTALPRSRHRLLPSRALLCFLPFSHLRHLYQPCPTLQAPSNLFVG